MNTISILSLILVMALTSSFISKPAVVEDMGITETRIPMTKEYLKLIKESKKVKNSEITETKIAMTEEYSQLLK